MESRPLDRMEDQPSAETPEDVAILYSWANLQGAKYRDYSASRREYRAQMRQRAAEQLRLLELRAQSEAEAAAKQAETDAAAAHAEAYAATVKLAVSRVATHQAGIEEEDVEYVRKSSLRVAAQQARKAAAERLEAARRAETAALADSIARREEREIAEAQASALRQAAQYSAAQYSESRQAKAATSEPVVPGRISDPYSPQVVPEGEYFERPGTPVADLQANHFRQQREYIERNTGTELPPFRMPHGELDLLPGRRVAKPEEHLGLGSAATDESLLRNTAPEPSADFAPRRRSKPNFDERFLSISRDARRLDEAVDPSTGLKDRVVIPSIPYREFRHATGEAARSPTVEVVSRIPEVRNEHSIEGDQLDDATDQSCEFSSTEPADTKPRDRDAAEDASGPAWLYPRRPAAAGQMEAPRSDAKTYAAITPGIEAENTLQQSRERVAARWFALRGVFAPAEKRETSGRQSQERKLYREKKAAPIVAVFSLAGGVGKTSLVATLGRALSSLGEKVLLADTASPGLLPFYFGASEPHPGSVRTFLPPSGSTDAPIHLVDYDFAEDEKGEREDERRSAQAKLVEDLLTHSQRVSRVLLDLDESCAWLLERIANTKPTILVPLAADMNSVLSLRLLEAKFSSMHDAEGRTLQSYYLLNQFDTARPLHLDVREVLRQQLGERLLPFVVRRAAEVSEALAEGMTIMDYDADSEVARDYIGVANWLRNITVPATAGNRGLRWSEQ